MGAASSVVSDDRQSAIIIDEVISQRNKPTDASDIPDIDSALKEIQRIRSIIHLLDVNALQGTLASLDRNNIPAHDDSTAEFSEEQKLKGSTIIRNLNTKFDQRFDSLRSTFLSIDSDRSGYISKIEFQQVLLHFF